MKKTISSFLSLIMLISMFGVSGTVRANEYKNYNVDNSYFSYTIEKDSVILGTNYSNGGTMSFDNSTLIITKLSDNFSRKLIVPDEIEGVKIENVVIEDYSYLETLVLSDGIKRFACFNAKDDEEYLTTDKREVNLIKYLQLGKEFIEEGFDVTKYNPFATLENLKRITVSKENPNLASKRDAIYSKNFNKIIMYPANRTNGSFTSYYLAKETTQIGDGAFNNVRSLTSIKGISKISKYGRAFEYSSITSASIPAKTLNINNFTFNSCKELKKVVLYGNVNRTIGKSAFENCNQLSKVTLKDTSKAPKISANAFRNTKKGIKFYVKNKTVANQLKNNLKNKGVKSAAIYIGKSLVFKNVG